MDNGYTEEYIITFTKKELEEIEGAIGCYIDDRCCYGEEEKIMENIIDKINNRLKQIEKFEKEV